MHTMADYRLFAIHISSLKQLPKMSSLAASRADNFYFPPEYDGRVHGGISKFNNPNYTGSNQWEKSGIIRFELPFDGWCLGCKRHMCKGLRFNAKKEKTGKYFSTTIFSFTTKCPSCPQEFVIKTDPEHSTYDFFDGLRKMEQDYETGVDDNVMKLTSDETRKLLEEDSIFRLEYDNEAKIVAEASKKRLVSLIDKSDAVNKNDYELNSKLRKKNRASRTNDKALKVEGEKLGLSIPLLERHESDIAKSREVRFKPRLGGSFGASERLKMTNIRAQSIFSNVNSSNAKSITNHSIKLVSLQKQSKLMINTAGLSRALCSSNSKGHTEICTATASSGNNFFLTSTKRKISSTESNALGSLNVYAEDT